MNKIFIIYKIFNRATGKFYIGKTSQKLERRWATHKVHGLKTYKNVKRGYLQNAIFKYGVENFTIVEIDTAHSVKHSEFLESFYIRYYSAHDPKYGYNLTCESLGGDFNISEQGSKNISSNNRFRLSKNVGRVGVSKDKKSPNSWICKFTNQRKTKSKSFNSCEDAAKCYDKLFMFVEGQNSSPPNFPDFKNHYLSLDLKSFFEEFFQTKNKYMGVQKKGDNRYVSMVVIEGKATYIGTFKSEREAAIAHDKAKYLANSKTTRYNFPELVKDYQKEVLY